MTAAQVALETPCCARKVRPSRRYWNAPRTVWRTCPKCRKPYLVLVPSEYEAKYGDGVVPSWTLHYGRR